MIILRFLIVCVLGWGYTNVISARPIETNEKDKKNCVVEDSLFQGVFFCVETGLEIHLDLQKESLIVPSMSFLGTVGGYMKGSIYGVWLLIKSEVKKRRVILRFTNDSGSDSQTISLTALENGVYQYQALEGNVIRKVEQRKLVKFPAQMLMHKK